jgi:transcriptional regulator with XRE-family HTH domain
MGFRENLKMEMEFSDVQGKELAAKAGIKLQTLKSYLGCRAKIPSAEAAVRIARALNVSVEYLVTGKNEKPSSSYTPTVRALVQTALELSEKDRETALEIVKVLKKQGHSR